MINSYTFLVDKWFISDDEPYINGELKAGLFLQSVRTFTFYDIEADYLDQCTLLVINIPV